jgi:hypothetical protein
LKFFDKLPLASASGSVWNSQKALANRKNNNFPYRFSANWAEAKRNFIFPSYSAKALFIDFACPLAQASGNL